MKFIDKLQRKFGKYAIPNLMNYIVVLYIIGFFMIRINPYIYGFINWNMNAILSGQVWRLVSFLLIPPSTDIFTMIIACYLYWSLGNTLERVWGTFRFNLYFLTGILGHILAGILVFLFTRQNIVLNTSYLNLSLFLAFAATYPNVEFLLFFILPIKAKWLGVANAALYIYQFIMSDWTHIYGWSVKIQIALSLINFIVFFAYIRNHNRISFAQIKKRQAFKKSYQANSNGQRHRCAICGRTELDGDDLEFRYCSKCDGNFEYCQDHLYTHKHVIANEQENRDQSH